MGLRRRGGAAKRCNPSAARAMPPYESADSLGDTHGRRDKERHVESETSLTVSRRHRSRRDETKPDHERWHEQDDPGRQESPDEETGDDEPDPKHDVSAGARGSRGARRGSGRRGSR